MEVLAGEVFWWSILPEVSLSLIQGLQYPCNEKVFNVLFRQLVLQDYES